MSGYWVLIPHNILYCLFTYMQRCICSPLHLSHMHARTHTHTKQSNILNFSSVVECEISGLLRQHKYVTHKLFDLTYLNFLFRGVSQIHSSNQQLHVTLVASRWMWVVLNTIWHLAESCLGICEVRWSTHACFKVQGEIIIYPCVIIIKLLRSIVIVAEFHC